MAKDRFKHVDMGYTNESIAALPGRPKTSKRWRDVVKARNAKKSSMSNDAILAIARDYYLTDIPLDKVAERHSVNRTKLNNIVSCSESHYQWANAVAVLINEGHSLCSRRKRGLIGSGARR